MEAPTSHIDIFSADNLLAPYEGYRQLRDLGPVVWLERLGMYAIARYADVHRVLSDGETFTSWEGVSMNEDLNKTLQGTLLFSNGERHTQLRRVIERPLRPAELSQLRQRIREEAARLVERLVAKGTFDAATELAEHLPVTIVSDLVGVPEEGRERMLLWSRAQGDAFAPLSDRTAPAMPVAEEMVKFAFSQCVPGRVKPGGWADMIWQAAERGEIAKDDCLPMMNDYMGPALDTTISATANMIWLFTQFPDQWRRLRDQPNLVPQAINEAVRLESPIQMFSRKATRDVEFDGVTVPAGARVIVMYGSANRDERFWNEPERFDITRSGSMNHLAFGWGEHRCVGMNLARLEISALLGELLPRVERIELEAMRRGVNSVLRVVDECVVTVH